MPGTSPRGPLSAPPAIRQRAVAIFPFVQFCDGPWQNWLVLGILPVKGDHAAYIPLGETLHVRQFIADIPGQEGDDARAPAFGLLAPRDHTTDIPVHGQHLRSGIVASPCASVRGSEASQASSARVDSCRSRFRMASRVCSEALTRARSTMASRKAGWVRSASSERLISSRERTS